MADFGNFGQLDLGVWYAHGLGVSWGIVWWHGEAYILHRI